MTTAHARTSSPSAGSVERVSFHNLETGLRAFCIDACGIELRLHCQKLVEAAPDRGEG
jgi:hypothetical protein